MYPPPSDELSAATVVQLDDQFFTSDPFAYVRSRVVALLDGRPVSPSGPIAEEFARLLGPASAHFTAAGDRARELQVAVDAFALRHHVAETLVRFLHVVLHHVEDSSWWVELIDTPLRNLDVIKQNHAVLEDSGDVDQLLRSVLLPPGATALVDPGPDSAHDDGDLIPRALATHIGWINYAIALLTQKSPDLDAAHNKLKHGMGLRPQDDLLMTFTTTPPNANGELPLSALTGDGAGEIFRGITAEFLARPGKNGGLEITQIAMNPAATLVEAAAMAHTTALLFHTAALKHFADHKPAEGRQVPDHPGFLLDGPLPGRLRGVRPFALRFPLTTPLRDPSRPKAELYWTDGDVSTVTFGDRMTGVVVDDPADFDSSPPMTVQAVPRNSQ